MHPFSFVILFNQNVLYYFGRRMVKLNAGYAKSGGIASARVFIAQKIRAAATLMHLCISPTAVRIKNVDILAFTEEKAFVQFYQNGGDTLALPP